MFYLAIFGSVVSYGASIYALDKLPVSVFSIYLYVNAVVAVALGWLVYREPLGLLARATMFAGVAIVLGRAWP